jgi:PAS domain S-box-containing protein
VPRRSADSRPFGPAGARPTISAVGADWLPAGICGLLPVADRADTIQAKGSAHRTRPVLTDALRDTRRPAEPGGVTTPPCPIDESAQSLERMSDGFYALDRDWRFTYINARFEAMTGTRRDDLIGRSIWEGFPELVDTTAHREHLRAVRKARPVFYEASEPATGRWIEGAIYPSETGLSVYLRDVTARKRAELMLREREATLESFYANAPLLMGIVELVGDDILHVYDNPAACGFFGRPADGTAGQLASALGAPPTAIDAWIDHYRACEARGAPVRFEYEHTRPDGACWLSVCIAVIGPGASGRTRFCYIAEDVTGRKRTEEALREREGRLEAALIASTTGTYRWDMQSRALDWDSSLVRLFGQHPNEMADYLDCIHPDDRAAVAAATERCRRDGVDFAMDYRIVRPDGAVRWVVDKGKVMRGDDATPLYMAGACTDITERKEAEMHAARLAAIVGSSEDAIIRQALDGTITAWNGGAERIYGYGAGEALERSTTLIAPPDRADEPRELVERVCRGEVIRSFETIRRRKDGRDVPVSLSVSPIRDAQGSIVAVSTISRDVSERRRMEEDLRRGEAEYRALFESAGVGNAEAAADGRLLRVNCKFCEITGYAPEELIGRSFADITHPDDRDESLAGLHRLRDGKCDEFRIEKRYRRKDGATVWIHLTASAIRDAAGRLERCIAVAEDITARKRAEAQQALLTAELSHRVKNTLAVVQAIASQTLRRASSLDSFADSFGGRLRALASVHGLLTRSGWRPTDLRTALWQAVQAHADGQQTFDTQGPDLELAPKQILTLGLVLHELATNAAKYGALSVPAGRVSVRWALEGPLGRPHLRLAWMERNGPPVARPAARGFGTRLIEESVTYELGGAATLTFDRAGLLCEIVIPWSRQPDRLERHLDPGSRHPAGRSGDEPANRP